MWTRLPARRVPCGATPSTETERMNPPNAIPDITTFYIQETGALLFGLVFWFLYRQSRAVYFGLWAVAWGLRLRPAQGVGSRFFRFSLLVLAVAFVVHAILFLILYNLGAAPIWARYLYGETLYDFVLHCALAFSAMAMWSESQIDRIRELGAEL